MVFHCSYNFHFPRLEEGLDSSWGPLEKGDSTLAPHLPRHLLHGRRVISAGGYGVYNALAGQHLLPPPCSLTVLQRLAGPVPTSPSSRCDFIALVRYSVEVVQRDNWLVQILQTQQAYRASRSSGSFLSPGGG